MKGIYTAGVLDFFLDKEILFSDCYGVSAGACHLCNYMSGTVQPHQRKLLGYEAVLRGMEPASDRRFVWR